MTDIVSAKLYAADGSYVSSLPNFQQMQVQEQLNTENAWTMAYDLNGIGASSLIADEDRMVAFLLDGEEFFRGVIEEDSWDEVNSESAFVTLAGRGMAGMLEFAKVYPNGGIGKIPASHTFTNASPGLIFKTLFLEAQARGCLPGWTLSFGNTTDSNGAAWTTGISITYQAGVSLLDLIKSFGSSNQADFRITGTTINMWNPKTILGESVDVTFRRGMDIVSSPRARSRRSLQTVAMVQGDNDITVERVDSGGVTARGRKEGFTSQGGITDTGTLDHVGDNILSVYSPARLSKTHNLSFDPKTPHPIPWVDYLPGDYTKSDITGTIETYRLIALNITLTNSGPLQGEITINDVFAEREVLLADQVNALGGSGTTTAGASTGTSTTPTPDGTMPGVPDFLPPFETQTYLDSSGISKSRVQLAWDAPLNTDGSVIVDGDHYEIRYRMNQGVIYPQTWAALSTTPWNALNTWQQPFTANTLDWQTLYVAFSETAYTIQDLATGLGYDVQIRAVDNSGNKGDWSTTIDFITNADNIAPSTPDAPTVAASLIAVQVTHDLGKATGGSFNLEQDLHHLEVHATYEPTFVPSNSTLLGKLPATQAMIQAQVPAVGTFQIASTTVVYVKVVAVDIAGNRSEASTAASTTAELIDDAHISSLTVSKVTAGTINADFLIGARIKTADTGARVELGPSGMLAYDSAGNNTVNISSTTGDASITGQFSSGLFGDRIVINPDDAIYPEIRFYPTTGVNYTSMTSQGDVFEDEATFFLTSGMNEAGTANATYEHAAGLIFSYIGNPTAGTFGGGQLQLNDGAVHLSTQTPAGIGGSILLDTSSAYFGSDASGGFAQMSAGPDGTTQYFLQFDQSAGQIYMQGRFPNYVDQGPTTALYTMSQVIGAFNSSAWGYGSTATNGRAPVAVLYNSAGTTASTVTASSSSGFTFSTTATTNASSRVFAWVFSY